MAPAARVSLTQWGGRQVNLSMGDTSPSLEEGVSLPEEVTYELLEGGT